MPILISNIALPFTAPPQEALQQALRLLGSPQNAGASIAKRSVDARKKQDIRFVYTVQVDAPGQEASLVERMGQPNVRLNMPTPLDLQQGGVPLQSRPVVVGLGPAGLFAALLLARQGYRPIVVERGADMQTRTRQVAQFWKDGTLNPDSNVQFGEGGAGTFSDGKLTSRINDSRCGYVFEELLQHGAPQEIAWQAKPHIGTDLLRQVVQNIRTEIETLGGEVHFNTCMRQLLRGASGQLRAVRTTAGDIETQALVLALGHSARDTFAMLAESGVALLSKPFSVGVRIEHLRANMERALYGAAAGHPLLPAAEYQHSWRQGEHGVYTFCMCPGGVVVPAASEEGLLVTNGMSEHARNHANSNSALVVSVGAEDYGSGAMAGVAFQRQLERAAFIAGGGGYRAPAQTAGQFLAGTSGGKWGQVRPSYTRGVAAADLAALFPARIGGMLREGLVRFGRKLPGFDAPDAVLTGVESRTSSPVRILRDDALQSPDLPGLFPCGEGAGYAGGIISAAVDGVRVAQALMAQWKPPV